MTTTPSPSPHPGRSWRDGVGGVAVRTGLTAAVALVAAEAAVLLVIFGYGWLALVIALVSLGAGLTVWRRGLLPCAVVACAVALPAAAATQDPFRMSSGDPGVGGVVAPPSAFCGTVCISR